MNVGRPLSFHALLTEAVADLSEHGYVSREQLDTWIGILRNAAERELGTEEAVNDAVRIAMDAIFRRLVDNVRVVQYVPSVSRYTLAMIKPQLRAELDRRILAAADLIKLHRREAIETTLRRFSGWSTSIPVGGEGAINKRQVKVHVTKGLKQYDFERRRVNIDQGHKLVANIAEIVAKGNGAIAGEWHSHWRQAGYNYREDHKERDLHVYAVRDSWAVKEGLINKGAGYTDDMTAPGQEPFCRCYVRWITSLRRVPDAMLTRKGQEWLRQSEMQSAA